MEENLIGVAYTPMDGEADFYIIELSLDEDERIQGNNYYCVHLEGGNIASSQGIEDFFGNDNIDELIKILPEFATQIQYKFYKLNSDYSNNTTEYALKSIFPELPDPDSFNDFFLHEFKYQAISLISKLNNC